MTSVITVHETVSRIVAGWGTKIIVRMGKPYAYPFTDIKDF